MKTSFAQPDSRPALTKINKRSVTDDVEEQLREAIYSGAVAPGENLPEAQIASQLGVSRASVRQAKFQLAQEGLLRLDSRGTARVLELTEEDVNELEEAREILEVGAFRLACQRLTPEAADRLQHKINLIEKEPDLLRLTLLDIDFHEEVVSIAGNSRLLSAWKLLRPQLQLWLASMHRLHHSIKTSTRKESTDSHRKLLRALKSGDSDKCEQLAREHAHDLRQTLLTANLSPAGLGVNDE